MENPNNPRFIFSILAFQTPLLAIVAYLFSPKNSFIRKPTYLTIYIGMVLYYILYSLYKFNDIPNYVKIGQHGHLSWNIASVFDNIFGNISTFIYFFIIFISCYIYFDVIRVRVVFALFTLFFFYTYLKYGETYEFGTMWCWIVNFIGFYAIF